LEGTLRGFYRAEGTCVDQNGDVFISNLGTGNIFEYAHGGKKPIRILSSPSGDPIGCAVDTTTGDLAVSSLGIGSNGSVAIYKNARGKPTLYQDPVFQKYYFCGYDGKGDLFVDGQSSSNVFEFAELAKGSSALKTITLGQSIGWPGAVQWDGQYVAVGDENAHVIYQFGINGSGGEKKGSTPLRSHALYIHQFWIQGHTVIVPNAYFESSKALSDVLFYRYPIGGKSVQKITKGQHFPDGAVVSLAPH
jgi:hypothetical protein